MIALCTYPLYASRAVMETRDSSWKPRSWCCGINLMSCSSARHGDRICAGLIALYSSGSIVVTLASLVL